MFYYGIKEGKEEEEQEENCGVCRIYKVILYCSHSFLVHKHFVINTIAWPCKCTARLSGDLNNCARDKRFPS